MSGEVKVIISFATEDFITPGHDDILLRLAGGLSERGLTGNFHLTGQLARALRARGRTDVVEALRTHEIGYHSDTHGALPFMGATFENNSWDDGIAGVLPAEAKGLRHVEELVGKRATYLTLEFVKAPQLIYAMRLLGIPQLGYSQIPTFGRAAAWMAGLLCCGDRLLLGMGLPPDTPDRLERMCSRFDQLYDRARAGENDSVIRAFLHPYKLITYPGKSWVSVNRWYRQARPPDGDWQVPGRLPSEVSRRLLAEHEALLDHMMRKPDVRFTPMSVLMEMYPQNAPAVVPIGTVVELAGRVRARPAAVEIGDMSYSPAETYALLIAAVCGYARSGRLPGSVPFRFALGPVSEPPQHETPTQVSAEEFLRTCTVEDRRIDFHQRMSSSFECGGKSLGPGTVLSAAAELVCRTAESGAAPDTMFLTPRANLPEVADDPYFQQQTFTREGSYPEGFTGANICRYCRLQSWSVKPAVLKGAGGPLATMTGHEGTR